MRRNVGILGTLGILILLVWLVGFVGFGLHEGLYHTLVPIGVVLLIAQATLRLHREEEA
jgi:hypothetical protein